MGYARKNLISLQDTPYYHCISRCVRRAWLWGFDEYAGRDYSHRKQWVIERLTQLCGIFPIEVCAYAVIVFRVDSRPVLNTARDDSSADLNLTCTELARSPQSGLFG
jgi:hypothetical protein